MLDAPFDIAADLDTPVSAFQKLRPLGARTLLESVETGGAMRLGRYSFLGFGEARHVRLADDLLSDGDLQVAAPGDRDGLLEALRAALGRSFKPKDRLGRTPDLPFAGGLVGAAGFDVLRRFDRVRTPARPGPAGHPELAYVSTRSMLVFDAFTRRAALLHDGNDAEREAVRAEVLKALRGPLPPPPKTGGLGTVTPTLNRDDFVDAVGLAQEHIRAGDLFQLVLSLRLTGATDLAPFEVYRALRLLNPSPYMVFVDLDDVQLVGSSPEALVRLQGGVAHLRPIAGTRPRGGSAEEDARLAKDLLADPKEAAEHVMLVDLARNDVGRVAVPGTVEVNPFRSVERFSHVMHMVSGVQGRVREGVDAFDVFAAAFPAGTVVGAPKLRAAEILSELEPSGRGLYAGTVGYFGHGDRMDQAIAIRTMMFANGQVSLQAGAGIVADSVPETEHQECLHKGAALRAALELAAGGLA